MCKEATVVTRVEIEEQPTRQIPLDEQSKMLCNVLVRATYELQVNQKKSRDEIQDFLKDDCEKLSTNQLVEKV